MKKKICISYIVILLMFFLFVFAGCDNMGNSNNNQTPPGVSTKLLAPHIISLGDFYILAHN